LEVINKVGAVFVGGGGTVLSGGGAAAVAGSPPPPPHPAIATERRRETSQTIRGDRIFPPIKRVSLSVATFQITGSYTVRGKTSGKRQALRGNMAWSGERESNGAPSQAP
jgi:hypothetical protein